MQPRPEGIAQALLIGADFIGAGPVCLILGDNLFFGEGFGSLLRRAAARRDGATLFACQVTDPQRFGVLGFDAAGQVQSITEKPVSSPFGVRFHPILRTIKMHTGIDYAAPTGTPIVAPSEGVVEETGYKGGYGHTIILRHNDNMQTLYAHMSNYGRFGVGSRVKAGDVIGYVGSTGRSTGPHLHYEVRINGQPVNPVTVAIPSKKLNAQELAQFKKEQRNLDNILAGSPSCGAAGLLVRRIRNGQCRTRPG